MYLNELWFYYIKYSCKQGSHFAFLRVFVTWIKRDQLDVTCFIISLFNAQHVLDVNTYETCWALNNEIIKQVTSIWSALFNYQDDAQSNKHKFLLHFCLSEHKILKLYSLFPLIYVHKKISRLKIILFESCLELLQNNVLYFSCPPVILICSQ